jgi:hypothetical protein
VRISPVDHEDCPHVLVNGMAVRGIEVTVSTSPPLVAGPYTKPAPVAEFQKVADRLASYSDHAYKDGDKDRGMAYAESSVQVNTVIGEVLRGVS